jgi:hypothetical protein
MTRKKCSYFLTEKPTHTFTLVARVILGFWLVGGSCLAADEKTTIERLSAVDETGALRSGDVAVGLNAWLGVVLKGRHVQGRSCEGGALSQWERDFRLNRDTVLEFPERANLSSSAQ